MMNHYLVLTDVNSRQYVYLIPENGIKIESKSFSILTEQQKPNFDEINILLQSKESFVVDNKAVFNSKHIITIQYQEIPEGAV